MQQGTEFTPARLKQKKPRDAGEEVNRGRASKHGNSMWEPSSSDKDHSDSEDSMSDLYPRQYSPYTPLSSCVMVVVSNRANICPEYLIGYVSYVPTATIFTLKNPAEENMEGDGDEAEDDFQTDEDEEMEVDKQVLQKRKKVCGNLNSFCLFACFWCINYIMPVSFNIYHLYVFQVQGGGFQKKFRNNRCKSGRKKRGKV